MNPAQRAFVTLWVVAGFGLLAGPPCHGLAAGFPGTDYDLQDLIGPQSEAVFEPKSGTIVTTGGSAKLLLPGMPASPPRQLRSVEVEILPAVDVQLHLTWFEGGTQLESPRAIAPADSRQTLVLDLSSMGESDGTVRLRVNGEHGGSVVSRVTLVERTQPNLVLVMVDDLRTVELDLGFGRSLARDSVLKDEIIDRGTTFTEFFNTTPLCCASRTSYLTGQYSHNHGIYGNNYNATGGNGGWRRFWELGHEHNSLGGWMQDAGYRTVLIGKFLNQYPNLPGDFVPETYVPAGWDEWYAEFNNETFVPPEPEFSYSSFRMNENGTVVEYLPPSYLTDVERDHAVDYVNRTAPSGDPFFMYLAPFAPHGPTEPAARHEGAHAAVEPPTPPPSFNEADLSDKPQHIQDGAVQWPNYFGTGGLRKLDMTLAIDELLEALLATLDAHGVLDETYIFFVSDNGLLAGEHRIGGKSAPYEESIRVPMLVRGPLVPAGDTRSELLLNIDLAPTLLELGGSEPPVSIDGESFVELLIGARAGSPWRDAVQVELRTEIASVNQNHVVPPYFGVRGTRHAFFEYETEDREIYDLVDDPFEMDSFHDLAPPELVSELEAAMLDFSTCAGQTCRDATRRGWPHADIQISCVLRNCSFDGSGSSASQGDLADFLWAFGNGESADGPKVAYEYPEDGQFFVTLTVTDSLGTPGVSRRRIFVEAPFFADGFESGDLSRWTVP